MSAEILTGDCLSVLASMPGRQWDHVITDPPYEAEAHSKGRRVRRGSVVGAEIIDFGACAPEQRRAWSAGIVAAARRWILVFCQVEALPLWRAEIEAAGGRYIRSGVWIKPDGQPQYSGDRPGCGFESLLICHAQGRTRWNGGGRTAVWTHCREQETWHQTTKPRALCESLIRDFTDPGESILDLFAGSGAIGKAALRLGRSYTGIEIREDWAERARADLAGIQQTEFSADGKPRQGRIEL